MTITSPEPIEKITITNLMGKAVYSQACRSEKAEVNISDLPAGMYLLRVTDNEGNKTVKRIVKE